MLGTGGMARNWIQTFWAPFRDRMEFAALVDVNAAALNQAGDALGLPASARFADAQEAFACVEADFCCIVTPPRFHRQAVELACARGMHILSEKPIADSWDDCRAIYRAVQHAGVKMLVTQNYRYTPRILTLKRAVGELGPVNYAVGRYASDYRVRLAWGAQFRHEMPHSLLVEASIHHFDQLRNLCSADCLTLSGYEWHPGQVRGGAAAFAGSDSFDGEPCGLFVMRMSNGSFASYEGNNLATGKTNGWHGEYYRVECERGVATLDKDHLVRIEERGARGTLTLREVSAERPALEGHQAIAAQFLDWLDGGLLPPTALADNIRSNAMLFAAIAAGTGTAVVDVQQLVREAVA
jgi:predicted dehydrogenase